MIFLTLRITDQVLIGDMNIRKHIKKILSEVEGKKFNVNTLLRRMPKETLDEIVYDNIDYMIDWSVGMEYEDICESYELCDYDKFAEAMMTVIIDDIEKMIEVPRDKTFYYGMKGVIKKLYKPQLQKAFTKITSL